MNNTLKVFTVNLLLFITFFLTSYTTVFAGCEDKAVCDAPPGGCSTTCNGNQPCQINNGGYFYQEICTEGGCDCEDSNGLRLGSCSSQGSLCGGGGGSNPYDVDDNDFGHCQCDTTTCELSPEPVFTCTETTWESCCTAGTPPPSGSPLPSTSPSPVAEYCGDSSCNAGIGENCATCVSDCGICNPPPPPPSGGGGGSSPYCGDDSCNNGESCSSCAADCGACSSGGSCGNGSCTGFETCESCAADCGVCIVEGNQPWWQASNGLAYAGTTSGIVIQSNIFDGSACVAPDCIAQLIFRDSTDIEESEGIAITGGGAVSANGFINTANSRALGTIGSRFKENYTFFYRNSGLGLNPSSDFTGQESDIQEPVITKEAYYHQGDLTLQSAWSVSNGESYVIFVNGNLTISDPTNINQLIDIEEGGFVAFIVSGTISIDENVGNETLTDTTSNIEGIFIADGTLTIESRGEASGGDDRFIGEGSFISWTEVVMDRDYSDGAGRETENQSSPTESFIFRPDFVKNVPTILSRPHSIWQESN